MEENKTVKKINSNISEIVSDNNVPKNPEFKSMDSVPVTQAGKSFEKSIDSAPISQANARYGNFSADAAPIEQSSNMLNASIEKVDVGEGVDAKPISNSDKEISE